MFTYLDFATVMFSEQICQPSVQSPTCQAQVSIFVAFYDCQSYDGGILTRLHTGHSHKSRYFNIHYHPITRYYAVRVNDSVKPRHSSGFCWPASHRSDPDSSPSQIMWYLQRRKRHWGRFSPSTSVFPVNSHSTDCSTFIIIYHPGLVQ
jgi:hypothetical protein